MIGKKINSTSIASLGEVKDILKARIDLNEKGVEPTYEQSLANEYVKKFVKLTPAKSRKLLEELKKMGFLDEKSIVKIVDLVPEDEDVLALLVPKDKSLNESQQKEVLETIKKFFS